MGEHESQCFGWLNRFTRVVISIKSIFAVFTVMIAIIYSAPVWAWINDDEEEDTVRFRQRLTFVIVASTLTALLHIRNSSVS